MDPATQTMVSSLAEKGVLGLVILGLLFWLMRQDKTVTALHADIAALNVRLLAEANARTVDAEKARDLLLKFQEKLVESIHTIAELAEKLEAAYSRRSSPPSRGPR